LFLTDPFIEIIELRHHYGNQCTLDIDGFVFSDCQRTALIGASGSGKSTLLKLIGGLEQPSHGCVQYKNQRVLGSEEVLIPGHPKIRYLNQQAQLKNQYRVEECLQYAGLWTNDELDKICKLFSVDLFRDRWTDELSGGEKQRIALVYELSFRPSLLLLDEPFAQLDHALKTEIMQALTVWQSENNCRIILATHDPSEALGWSESICVLSIGKIIQSGTPMQVYRNPINENAARLLGPVNPLHTDWLNQVFNLKLDPIIQGMIFARPDNFEIHSINDSHEGVEGEIMDLRYFGHYEQLKIKIADHTISVNCHCLDTYSKGDIVKIGLYGII
jgi:ABC-type Fe3+/spermidine/putrescine transport system ATPase subunit